MRFGWRGVAGVIISAAALYWTLRDVNFAEVGQKVREANGWLLLASTVAATMIFPLRARRWRPILASVAPGLRFGQLWRPTAIGIMVSNIFPARAGEPARAYALTRETRQVPFTTAFASIAVDRVFDAAVVLLLMALATLDPRFAADVKIAGQPVGRWMLGGLIGAGVIVSMLYLMVFRPAWIIGMWSWTAHRTIPKWEARGRTILESFANGLGVLRSPGRFIAVFSWALVHWLMNAFSYHLAFMALGIDVPFSAGLLIQGLIAIGVAAPAAPGFIGLFELFAVGGLAVYGIDKASAATWALVYHTLSFIPITLIGAYYFVRLGVHMSDVKGAQGTAAAREPAA